MAKQNQVLDMSPLKMRTIILKAASDTGRNSLEVRTELLPGYNMKDVLLHSHPLIEETWNIMEGETEYVVGDRWFKAKAGDSITIEKNIPHAFRNPTGNTTVIHNMYKPSLRMENFFEDLCRVVRKSTSNGAQPFQMNLKTRLYFGVLLNNYRDEIRLLKGEHLLFSALGAIGNWMQLKY